MKLFYRIKKSRLIKNVSTGLLCLLMLSGLNLATINSVSAKHIHHTHTHRIIKKHKKHIYKEHKIKHHHFLKANANYIRPFYISSANRMHYQSQGHSVACEAASIKNILSIHNIANHVSLYQMCKTISWNNDGHGNWNFEYTGDPYTDGSATISPWLMARTLRYYGLKAHVHNYASQQLIINDLKKGMQLIPETGRNCSYKPYYYHHHWKQPDHILALIGIKRNPSGILYVQYADSEHATRSEGVKWCKFSQFWKSYNRPKITGNRLVITGYK